MERKEFIDYAKALSIITIMLVHIGFSVFNNILLFTMPLFFAATGYTFSYGKRGVLQSIAVRFKTIMLPFFALMLVYTVIEVIRATLFRYGGASVAIPSLINMVYGSAILPFSGGIFEPLKEIMSYKAQPGVGVDLILPTNCHLWFLPAMFSAYAIFVSLVGPLRRRPLLRVVAVCALLSVAALEVVFVQLCQLPLGVGRGALGAAFMLLGFWIREYKLLEGKTRAYYLFTALLSLLVFLGALFLGSNGSALVRSVYGPYGALSVALTFVGGAAGIWLVLCLCRAIEGLPFNFLKRFLAYIGKNVMTIYAWHMAIKFLLDAVYICIIKDMDITLLDAYKMSLVPQSAMWFMLFEVVAVMAGCLLLSKLKARFHRLPKRA